MAAGTVATFEASLDALDVQWTHADPGDVSAVIEDLIEPPAVGAPLPFDGVSLPVSVETDPTPARLAAARTGVTAAGIGIADYGSIVIQGMPDGTEPVSLFNDLHVAVLRAADVVPGMPEAFEWIGREIRGGTRGSIIATGPSATADMGALVRGAHGPKRVHVVIVDE